MKTSASKLFRKTYLNRQANHLMEMIATKAPCTIKPIESWWKARNVKDTL